MQKPVVVAMPRTSVSEDGNYAEMQLKTSDGKFQTLRFSPKTFLTLLNRVFELFLNERMQKAKASGYVQSDPLPSSSLGTPRNLLGTFPENGVNTHNLVLQPKTLGLCEFYALIFLGVAAAERQKPCRSGFRLHLNNNGGVCNHGVSPSET